MTDHCCDAHQKLAEIREWALAHQAKWADVRSSFHSYKQGTMEALDLLLKKMDES